MLTFPWTFMNSCSVFDNFVKISIDSKPNHWRWTNWNFYDWRSYIQCFFTGLKNIDVQINLYRFQRWILIARCRLVFLTKILFLEFELKLLLNFQSSNPKNCMEITLVFFMTWKCNKYIHFEKSLKLTYSHTKFARIKYSETCLFGLIWTAIVPNYKKMSKLSKI